jgi:hypothetical protein
LPDFFEEELLLLFDEDEDWDLFLEPDLELFFIYPPVIGLHPVRMLN